MGTLHAAHPHSYCWILRWRICRKRQNESARFCRPAIASSRFGVELQYIS
jgi:hypothetical protein